MDAAGTAAISERYLAGRLRAGGLRATRPRLLVLRILSEVGGHLSADDIAAELQNRGMPIPRASVYGVVAALLTHGFLMITDAGPGRTLYELGDPWHHHFVCRTCGAIQDVVCVVGDKPCVTPDRVDGVVDEAQIIFRGRCRRCLTKEAGGGEWQTSSSIELELP